MHASQALEPCMSDVISILYTTLLRAMLKDTGLVHVTHSLIAIAGELAVVRAVSLFSEDVDKSSL